MKEERVRAIAEEFVKGKLMKCSVDRVSRINSGPQNQTMWGDEWLVRFRFEPDEDGSIFAHSAFVIVDDFTGEPRFLRNH